MNSYIVCIPFEDTEIECELEYIDNDMRLTCAQWGHDGTEVDNATIEQHGIEKKAIERYTDHLVGMAEFSMEMSYETRESKIASIPRFRD